jgi:hypothetical protein
MATKATTRTAASSRRGPYRRSTDPANNNNRRPSRAKGLNAGNNNNDRRINASMQARPQDRKRDDVQALNNVTKRAKAGTERKRAQASMQNAARAQNKTQKTTGRRG